MVLEIPFLHFPVLLFQSTRYNL